MFVRYRAPTDMTVSSYYRNALWLPLLVPVLAACIVFGAIRFGVGPSGPLYVAIDTAQFLVVAGLFSVLPYGIFLAAVLRKASRYSEADWRRLSWLAPSYVAGPFALVAGMIALPLAGFQGAFTTAWFLGIVALLTGYAYAVAINGALRALRNAGCVESAG